MTRFQNEYISIHRPKTRLLCDAFIVIYGPIKTKLSWAGHINRHKDDGPRVSPLGDHMTRKDDKGDQPSGGETT